MKKVLLSISFLLVAAGLAGWIWLRRFERGHLYHPVAEIAATPAQFSLRYQDVQFNAADGTPLAGWWIPANSPRGTVVFCHGNAVNVGDVAVLAPEFFKRGFNLLLWDYRGYGASAGRPSEKGIYADARAAFDAAQAMSDKLPILVYGHSLGAAVAIQLAQDRPVAGLIVDGGFLSTADLARRFYPHLPFDRLLSEAYDSGPKVAALAGLPKLFGHSPTDQTVPFQSGRLLHGAAANPKIFVLLAGAHSDHSWFASGAPGNAPFEAFLAQFKR